MPGELRVTQIKSAISAKPKARGTLRALGLRGIGQTNTLLATVGSVQNFNSRDLTGANGYTPKSTGYRYLWTTGQDRTVSTITTYGQASWLEALPLINGERPWRTFASWKKSLHGPTRATCWCRRSGASRM